VSDAKADVLQRVRSALGGGASVPEVPREYRGAGSPAPSGGDIVELFCERCADYRATVRRVSAAELPAAVAAACEERGAKRLVVPPGGPTDLEGVETTPDDGFGPRELDGFDGVLTGCALAIAETGTIVLDAGPGQGRRVLTLLPDHHLCIVRADQVVPDVATALERLDPRRPLTWISGPSATSDIELQRIEGVHGPRNLHVLIVLPAGGSPA